MLEFGRMAQGDSIGGWGEGNDRGVHFLSAQLQQRRLQNRG